MAQEEPLSSTEGTDSDISESDDLRSSLEAAYDSASSEDGSEVTPTEPAEPSEPITDTDISAQTGETPAEPPEMEPIEPPYSWAADKKEMFSQLPRDVQEYITHRESERDNYLRQKSEEIGAASRHYEDIDRVLSPRVQEFALQGVSPAQVIQRLFAAHDLLEQDPVTAMNYFMHEYGLSLADLQSQPYQPQPTQQPVTRQELLQILRQQQEETAQSSVRNNLREQIKSLADEKDQSGKPVFPHFRDVAKELSALIPIVRANTPNASTREVFQEAYSRAVRANPAVWSKVEAENKQKQAEEQQKKVRTAKLAGSSLSGTSPGVSVAPKNQTLRAELEAAYDEIAATA